MKVFLTGATGYIGGTVAAALLAAGHKVVGLVRSEQPGVEAAIRAKLVEHINTVLPLPVRGKFLVTVRDADTPRKLMMALARVGIIVWPGLLGRL